MSSIVVDFNVANFQGEGLEIVGTDNADTLFGTNDGELIKGLDGDDSISASDGNDFILGGAGNDTIGGGDGNDSILGSKGGDLIFAYTGDDAVHGGKGNDIIRGGEGSDILFGGDGKDYFVFDLENFADGSMDTVADYDIDDDQIFMQGLTGDDAVGFDAKTGVVTVNDQEVIKFDNIDEAMNSAEEFELF
jgi:Ca2+-binding RTX toxin-like protein